MVDRLTRERVVDAAAAIVDREGLGGLSMRALSEQLDVSVTSIYWHVGNKEALLDALIERAEASFVEREPTGDTPRQRVRSIASSVLAAIGVHGELIGVAHRRGTVAGVFAPARRAVVVELSAAGLRGEHLADATNAILQFIVGHSLTESIAARTSVHERVPVRMWNIDAPVDAIAAERLSQPPDRQRSFDVGLDALITGLLAL